MSEPNTITIPRSTLAALCEAVLDGVQYESRENGPDRYVCAHCRYGVVWTQHPDSIPHSPDCPVHVARDVRKTYLTEDAS